MQHTSVDPADWATLWQSEMAAIATDPECLEQAAVLGQAWMALADAAGRAGTDAPAGAAPLDAAPELVRQLDELRRRLLAERA
jgi:hypothetical protein